MDPKLTDEKRILIKKLALAILLDQQKKYEELDIQFLWTYETVKATKRAIWCEGIMDEIINRYPETNVDDMGDIHEAIIKESMDSNKK